MKMELPMFILVATMLFSTSHANSDQQQQPASCWNLVPAESCDRNINVADYILLKQYRRSCDSVADAAIEYAESIEAAADGKDVWVFAIDETLLSNHPYYARYDELESAGGIPYNCRSFYEWVAQGIAPPVPGMRRLHKRLLSLGFKTVILTDTSERYRDARIANLNRAGYHNWERLILKAADEVVMSSTLYKSKKRRELVNEGYRIVGNVGDEWSDLMGSNVGTRTFKLPHPPMPCTSLDNLTYTV